MGKKPFDQRAQDGIKNVVAKMIQNISIIAIFIAIGVVTLAYSGAEFNDISAAITGGFAVSSGLLMISNIVIYELWMRNGQENGRKEQDYIDTVAEFESKSKNIHSGTMQEFIVWEEARRYDVEKRKLEAAIKKLTDKLAQKDLSDKARTNIIIKRQRLQDHIIEIDMPYKVAEEFDELRYSIKDVKSKEYKPNDTRRFLKKNRIKKYILTATFTIFSINLIVMGTTTKSGWGVVLAVALATVALIISIVTGFSNGYSSIMVSNLGVYKTANDFINKAIGWCERKNISLYYKEETYEFSVYALDKTFNASNVDLPEDYYRPTLEESFGRQEVIIE